MNEVKMVEELAKIEGLEPRVEDDGFGSLHTYWPPVGKPVCGYFKLPDYLTSHDAMQRVIDGLDGDQLKMYELHLYNVVLIAKQTGIQRAILLATPAQKAEAVLKALGLWEETA